MNLRSKGPVLSKSGHECVLIRAAIGWTASRSCRAGRWLQPPDKQWPEEITLDAAVTISTSTWLAARISGEMAGERPAGSVEPFARYVSRLKRKADSHLRETLENAARPKQTRLSAAHTAPVYIQVRGTRSIFEQRSARNVAKARLDLLDDLAARLDDAHLGDMAGVPVAGDGVTVEDLRSARTIPNDDSIRKIARRRKLRS